MKLHERLSALLKEKKISGSKLGRAVGVSAMAVSKWTRGIAEPDLATIWRIAEVLGVQSSDLTDPPKDPATDEEIRSGITTKTGYGPGPKKQTMETENENGYITLPMLSPVASAGGGAMNDNEHQVELVRFHPDFIRGYLQTDPRHLRLLQVVGDSMMPTLYPGETLIVDVRPVETIVDGVYLIRLNEALMVKRLQQGRKRSISIISDNPMFKPIELEPDSPPDEFAICGKLVWAGRRF